MTWSFPLLIGVPCSFFLKVFGALQQYFFGLPDPHCCIELLHLAQVRMCRRLFISFDPFGLPLVLPICYRAASGLLSVCCGLCFMSGSSLCRFVCGMSSVSVMQDRLQKGLPSVAITGLPIAIPLHTALRRFDIAFRVAGFVRADLTLFPEMSPVTCEGDTALVLASCKGFTFYQISP